jgi:hypothetical protein
MQQDSDLVRLVFEVLEEGFANSKYTVTRVGDKISISGQCRELVLSASYRQQS